MFYYQRLRDMREDANKKQADISKLLDTTQQQYSRWEQGQQEIPFHHAKTLARFYNVSLDYLAGLIDVPERLDRK